MTPPTGCPEFPAIGDKTAASLLLSYGDLRGIIAAAADPSSEMSPGPRRRILDATDYLEVAPTVVAVARDIDLASYDAVLPSAPRDPQLVEALTERYGLGSAPSRLTTVLGG